jgi:hypothetical protein
MEMVTWTFDLTALIVGFIAGLFVGALGCCLIEMRDGGSWSKGFSEGFNVKCTVEKLERVIKEMREKK